MGLSNTNRSLIEKARNVGDSDFAVPLSDATCRYLAGVIVRDLGLSAEFPDVPAGSPEFFSSAALEGTPEPAPATAFLDLMERLVAKDDNAATYFYCLAVLQKARLKYAKIMKRQAIPTMEQVGPRGLLQYGTLSPAALAAFMFWRKWLYDIDNRAAQEMGYVFEPLIANAVGGTPASAKRSPIKRHKADTNGKKTGRQVDCIRDKRAYEIKMRVTIAASGQGRWGEELDFPVDAQSSGYTPVLVVFDGTDNAKLRELAAAFRNNQGEAHIGADAWRHLDELAGPTMAKFIERYVRAPLQSLLDQAPADGLPDIMLRMSNALFVIEVGGERWEIAREPNGVASDIDDMPDDVD